MYLVDQLFDSVFRWRNDLRALRSSFLSFPGKGKKKTCSALPALFLLALAGSASAQTTQLIVLRAENLASAKARLQSGDRDLQRAFDQLIANANAALREAPVAVTDKKTLLPPTNDPHDYFSLSPYWWPDSTKPNGLPYIRRDGVTNPESKRDLDQPRVHALGDRTQTLALAYYFTGQDSYAEAAAKQIKRWFLDPATRMNPHLRFAQLVRGNPNERGSGIIDTRWFIEIVDATVLLRGSKHWTNADDAALKSWFSQYLNWLLTSPNGAHERAAKNNHGSWYAAQTAAYALYVGDAAKAKEIIEAQKARIGAQIKTDGSQPEELARTRSLHYEMFNVEALGRVAEMGRHVGVNLWSYHAPEGGSLRKAVERLAQYAGREKEWPGDQISDVEPPLYASSLRRAAAAMNDEKIAAAVQRIGADAQREKSALLYPLRLSTKANPSGAVNGHPRIFL
ncbi:MAG TPA: alginate lyase family protein, partial [Longimicrobiales bacterium]